MNGKTIVFILLLALSVGLSYAIAIYSPSSASIASGGTRPASYITPTSTSISMADFIRSMPYVCGSKTIVFTLTIPRMTVPVIEISNSTTYTTFVTIKERTITKTLVPLCSYIDRKRPLGDEFFTTPRELNTSIRIPLMDSPRQGR